MITINTRGARTLADAQPLVYGGQPVYVAVEPTTAYLFLAGHVVAERPAAEITGTKDAQDWAYETIEAAEELVAGQTPDEDAVAEAVYGGAVAEVHKMGHELIALADETAKLAGPGEVWKYRTTTGKVRRFHDGDPRHPQNAAKTYREQGEVLATWTAQDEMGYSDYVSQGLGDTDGYYGPVDRVAWKSTQA
jgi:hypothetical protein